MTKSRQPFVLGALAAGLVAAGCSQLPDRVESLEQARSVVSSLERDPLAREVAPLRFERAQEALASAQTAQASREPLEVIEYHAHVALRNAQIAQLELDERRERESLEEAETEIDELLLRQQQDSALIRELRDENSFLRENTRSRRDAERELIFR